MDAAFAALAEHVARRDGWAVPAWATSSDRTTLDWWFIDSLPGLQAFALRESPLSFRKRGVFIGERALHPDSVTFFESASLRVNVASPQYMLAMKLLAAYPAAQILPKTQYMLAEIVESLGDES